MRKFVIPLALAATVSVSSPLRADDLARGVEALQTGNAAEALRLLKPLAAGGNASAQLHLGLMYYNGHGVKENEKEAVALLRKAAANGKVEAMYQLGNVFTFGQTTASLVDDPDIEAAKWYHQAATAGNADAQYSLGLLFMSGKGVVKDLNEANYWMQRAANAGHPDARTYVGGR